MKRLSIGVLAAILVSCSSTSTPAQEKDAGFVSLFNGKDFSGWVVPEGDNGHWKVVDGVIDYDALSESKGAKHLFSQKEYGDFTLKVDWRLSRT
jgi:hypothetical protein